MTKFEKTGDGEAKAVTAQPEESFPMKAEEMVEKSNHPEGPPRSMTDALPEDVAMIQFQADRRSKNRAQALLSRDVVRDFSPSGQLHVDRKDNDPMGYHLCCPKKREKQGMKGWVAVTDMEKAKELMPTKLLRKGDDGKIYSGELFLAEQPWEQLENLRALYYQRSQRNQKAAAAGQMAPFKMEGGKAVSGGQTMSDLNRETATAEDPGIRMSAKHSGLLRDD